MASARRLAPVVVGASLGLLAGIGLGVRAVALQSVTAPCPSGWSSTNAPAVAGARSLVACTQPGPSSSASAGAPSPRSPIAALYRVDGTAASTLDRWIDAAFHGAFAAGELAPITAPGQEATDDEPGIAQGTTGRSRTRDLSAELPLRAQVYFLSAGRRFGLLSVVHTPGEAFAEPATTARWMETIRGTAPWGAPNAGELQASCPEGFTTLPNGTGARTIVRCMRGAGTSRFVTLSLTWDEGGFGNDEDRTRVATAIAERVAHAQGAQARVEVAPEPFTLARNVDAIRTQVSTGENVHPTVRVVAAGSVEGTPEVLALGIGEPSAPVTEAMGQLLRSSGAVNKPARLSRPVDAALAGVALLALGALLGFAVSSRREGGAREA